MREHNEKINPHLGEDKKLTSVTPYYIANLSVKTAMISFTVSGVTQPLQAILNSVQGHSGRAAADGLFRSMYRGFGSYALAGQKKGLLAVSSKQVGKKTDTEIEIEESPTHVLAGTIAFSQADIVLSNGLTSKAKLENVGIISKGNFNWNLNNFWKLTTGNWGSRSIVGLINFSAIGFVGDYISSLYKFDSEFLNKLAGGATTGVITPVFTTLPNSYADKKTLASKMENGRLVTESPFTMFKKMSAHLQKVGAKEAFLTIVKVNFFKELLVRSPQSGLTFAIIFGMDHLMGSEPLQKFWPKTKEIDMEEPRSPSKGL